jgi:hypothetical protein
MAEEMAHTDHDLALVTAMLAAAGVHPSEPELVALAGAYPGLRRQVEALYAVDAGDLPPASMLRAGVVEGGAAP